MDIGYTRYGIPEKRLRSLKRQTKGKARYARGKETKEVISPQIIQDYRRLFVNRPADTLQSARPHPETGRHYYFTPKKVGTGAPVELTESTIRRHLEGEITIGLYAINPDNQRCKWLAIDADYQNAMEDLLKLQYRLTQDGVEPALELSRRGGISGFFLRDRCWRKIAVSTFTTLRCGWEYL